MARAFSPVDLQPLLRVATLLVAAATLALLFLLTRELTVGAREEAWARVETERRIDRIDLLEEFVGRLVDVETAQRGYVLTGQQRFLDPLLQAEARLPGLARRLRASHPGRAEQAAVAALLEAGERKLAQSRRVVAAARAGNGAEAEAMVASGIGKQLMDALRAQAGALRAREERDLSAHLLHAAEQRADRARRQRFVQLALLGALALLTAIAIAALQRARRSASEARDSARRQAAIFEGASDAMLILDSDGRIETCNSAAERLFGYARAELLGRSNLDLFDDPPDPAVSRAYLARLAGAPGQRGDQQSFVGRRGDGSQFVAEVVTTAIRLGDGQRYVAVARDATERDRVQRLKDDFASTVSHELRTPMTAIAGALAMLDHGVAGELPEKARKLVAIAHSSSQRMVRLVNDILDTEKLAAGEVDYALEVLALDEVVAEVVGALEPYAAQHRVTIAIEGGGGPPVCADRDRLIQIITNLMSNAIKFSPAGATVGAWIAPTFCGGQRLSIVDRGEGIDPAFRDRLFTRFAQADGSHRRKVGGTGLGLAISKQLADQMGIGIGVESRRGFTAFTLEFPPVEQKRE